MQEMNFQIFQRKEKTADNLGQIDQDDLNIIPSKEENIIQNLNW